MDIGKSIKLALVQQEKKAPELAKDIEIKYPTLNNIIKHGKTNTTTLERIANGLNMRVSELIALGEGVNE